MWYRETSKKNHEENVRFDVNAYESSFFRAVKPAFYFAQLFGILPINVRPINPIDVRFKWKSLRAFISMFTIFTSAATTICIFKHQVNQGPLTARNIIGIIFFSSCCFVAILLYRVSMKWKMLMINWMNVEALFLNDAYTLPNSRWSLRKRILVCTIIYLTFSLLEHAWFLTSDIYKLVKELETCNKTNNEFVEYFISRHLEFVIENLPVRYNHFVGFAIEYLNFSYTFYWNFLDLFIILISIGIAFLFEKLNSRLQSFKGRIVDESVWAEVRFHYVEILELLQLMNENLNVMIFLACFIDGYFVLSQLINITTSLPYILNKIYFWYSTIFLQFRMSAFFVFASIINENARKPLIIFRTIPSDGWCEELERFFNQIKADAGGLSGKRLFFITRSLLFSLAGILLTYVLVLFQFDMSDDELSQVIDCSVFKEN